MVRRAAFILALLAATPALAGPRDDVYAASQRCVALADDRAWLDCYYGAAQPMRGQLKLPPAPTSQTALVPPAGTVPPPQTLAMRAAPRKDGPVGRTIGYLAGGAAVVTDMPIQSYEAGRQGGFTVVLANGQVWRQTDDQTRFVRWRDGAQAHRVTIHKGALDSFNLAFDKESDRYKVQQIK
jgi:hypothetical protein